MLPSFAVLPLLLLLCLAPPRFLEMPTSLAGNQVREVICQAPHTEAPLLLGFSAKGLEGAQVPGP